MTHGHLPIDPLITRQPSGGLVVWGFEPLVLVEGNGNWGFKRDRGSLNLIRMSGVLENQGHRREVVQWRQVKGIDCWTLHLDANSGHLQVHKWKPRKGVPQSPKRNCFL